jgi:CRP/FNR family transcriptional regulator, cyclic AMP receptor protein
VGRAAHHLGHVGRQLTNVSTHSALVTLLPQTHLFGGLSPDEIADCAALFRPTRFDRGAALFSRGDASTHLYLLAEGRVRLAVATDEGRELSFRVAAAGDLFGEIGVLDGSTRSADATALSAVVAYTLERNAFRTLWSSRGAIATNVVAFLCRRLRETTDQLESIALHPLHVRLARFFLFALAGRQAPAGKRVPLDLGFSQGELAQLLGASRPKVNTALGELEQAGAIVRTLDRFFCDPAKLTEIARPPDA